MNVSAETYVVVALAFAVFSAVTAIGSALILGIGYERLRSGLERVKESLGVVSKQSGFFANAIHGLDTRVKELDSKTETMYETSKLERELAEGLVKHAENMMQEASHITRQITTKAPETKKAEDLSLSADTLKPALSSSADSFAQDNQSLDLQVPHFYPKDEHDQVRYM